MRRVHRRIFRLNDRISALAHELDQTRAELVYHRSIDDDAQRDAAVGNYIDREEAGLTTADVRRFEMAIKRLESQIASLEARRDTLVARLNS